MSDKPKGPTDAAVEAGAAAAGKAPGKAGTCVPADPALARRLDRTPQQDMQVELLVDSMVKARDYDFSGFVFPADFAGFDGVKFDAHADFSGARFLGGADFRRATFTGGVTFDRAEFDGRADFSDMQVWGLQFTGVQAWRAVDLRGARIEGADLDGTRIEGDLVLAAAHIRAGATLRRLEAAALDFRGAVADQLDLGGARIRGAAAFECARIEGEADLARASLGGVDFTGARVGGALGLAEAVVGRLAEFSWAKVGLAIDLRGARLGSVDFHAAEAGVVDLREAEVRRKAYFEQVRVAEHAIFRQTRFRGAVSFANARFGGAADFHRTFFFGEVDLHGASIPQEGDFHRVSIRKGCGESFCRFARLVLTGMGLHRQAADWRFAECHHAWCARRRSRIFRTYRRLRQRGLARGVSVALAWLWAALAGLPGAVFGRWIFGYGERPLRVLATSMALILLCWPLYLWGGGSLQHEDGSASMGAWESLRHSVQVFATFGNTMWQPAPGSAVAWLQTLQGLLAPLLLILFAVTLTRRWSRG